MCRYRPEEDEGEEIMAGQKINWWDSDAGSAPKRMSNAAQNNAMPMNANMPTAPTQQGAIQATPVIQPLVVVPYSTPMQPLYHYGDGTLPIGDIDSDYMRTHGGMMPGMNPQGPMMPGMSDDIYYNMDEKETEKLSKSKKRKGVGAVPILVMILIALFGTLQMFFAPLLDLLKVTGQETAFAVVGAEKTELYSSIMTVVRIFTGEVTFAFNNYALLAQCCLAITTALLAIVFLLSLISITRRKLPIFVRILIILALLFTAGSIVLFAFLVKGATLGLSCYVLGGIIFLIFIISLFGKSNKIKSKKRGRGRR